MTFRPACQTWLPACGDARLKLGTREIRQQALAGIQSALRQERLARAILEASQQRQGRFGEIAPRRLAVAGNLDRFGHVDPVLSGKRIVGKHGSPQKTRRLRRRGQNAVRLPDKTLADGASHQLLVIGLLIPRNPHKVGMSRRRHRQRTFHQPTKEPHKVALLATRPLQVNHRLQTPAFRRRR